MNKKALLIALLGLTVASGITYAVVKSKKKVPGLNPGGSIDPKWVQEQQQIINQEAQAGNSQSAAAQAAQMALDAAKQEAQRIAAEAAAKLLEETKKVLTNNSGSGSGSSAPTNNNTQLVVNPSVRTNPNRTASAASFNVSREKPNYIAPRPIEKGVGFVGEKRITHSYKGYTIVFTAGLIQNYVFVTVLKGSKLVRLIGNVFFKEALPKAISVINSMK